MAYRNNNTFGIQRVEETEVASNGDVGATTGKGAAAGASLGTAIMPGWGTAIGAVVGAGVGFIGAKTGQAKQRRQRQREEDYNVFVDSLGGRTSTDDYAVQQQARNGMNFKKYDLNSVEIEGDGSGDPNGIGEVHVDKNYNIKNVAAGAPTHEEGGVSLASASTPSKGDSELDKAVKEKALVEGDKIFPWQKDEKKYRKGMKMIQRFKLNRDPKAKEWLDKESERLPTNEDYGYNEEQQRQYGNGLRGELRKLRRNNEIDLTREQIKAMSDEEMELYLEGHLSLNEAQGEEGLGESQRVLNAYDQPAEQGGGDTGQEITLTGGPDNWSNPGDEFRLEDVAKKNVVTTDGTPTVQVEESAIQPSKDIAPQYKIINDYDDKWDYRVDQQTGKTDVKLKTESNWRAPSKSWGQKNKSEGGFTNEELTRQRVQPDWAPPTQKAAQASLGEVKPYSDPGKIDYGKVGEGQGPEVNLTGKTNASEAFVYGNQAPNQFKDEAAPITTSDQQTKRYPNEVGNYNNPLKYASAANNLLKSTEPAEKVTRRSYRPDELNYQDRSESARQANVENRNFMTRRASQRVGRSGALGTLGQIGAQYMRSAERINEAEARRYDTIENANIQGANRAKMVNLQNANKYDVQDAQNRGARQRYQDQAWSDVATLAQYDEQKQYMRNRDLRKEQIQQDALPLVGTQDFQGGRSADGSFDSTYKGDQSKSTAGRGRVYQHTDNPNEVEIVGGGRLVEVSPGVWKRK